MERDASDRHYDEPKIRLTPSSSQVFILKTGFESSWGGFCRCVAFRLDDGPATIAIGPRQHKPNSKWSFREPRDVCAIVFRRDKRLLLLALATIGGIPGSGSVRLITQFH